MSEACARQMELRTYGPYQTIVEAGVKQLEFSLLLEGTAEVILPSHLNAISSSRLSLVRQSRNYVRAPVFSTALVGNEIQPIMTLSPGDGIGENALNIEKTNICSVYSRTQCTVAYVPASQLLSLSLSLRTEAHISKVQFLKSLPGFSQFTYNKIEQLSEHFAERSYSLNQVVYREGGKCEAMYAIKSGQVEFSKSTTLSRKDSMKKLFIKTAGDIFGDLDLLNRLTYSATATSTSTATVLFVLDGRFFKDFATKTGLAKQLTSRSELLHMFYSSREAAITPSKTLTRDPVSLKTLKTYSKVPPNFANTKLLNEFDRSYNIFKARSKLSSVSRDSSPGQLSLAQRTRDTSPSQLSSIPAIRDNYQGQISLTQRIRDISPGQLSLTQRAREISLSQLILTQTPAQAPSSTDRLISMRVGSMKGPVEGARGLFRRDKVLLRSSFTVKTTNGPGHLKRSLEQQ
jgi:CRP-like cAMP-binding protein